MNRVHAHSVVIARLHKKSRIKKYKKEVANYSMKNFVPIEAFGVSSHLPLHTRLPFAASLVVTAITTGTAHLPAARAQAFRCRAGAGQSLAPFLPTIVQSKDFC